MGGVERLQLGGRQVIRDLVHRGPRREIALQNMIKKSGCQREAGPVFMTFGLRPATGSTCAIPCSISPRIAAATASASRAPHRRQRLAVLVGQVGGAVAARASPAAAGRSAARAFRRSRSAPRRRRARRGGRGTGGCVRDSRAHRRVRSPRPPPHLRPRAVDIDFLPCFQRPAGPVPARRCAARRPVRRTAPSVSCGHFDPAVALEHQRALAGQPPDRLAHRGHAEPDASTSPWIVTGWPGASSP